MSSSSNYYVTRSYWSSMFSHNPSSRLHFQVSSRRVEHPSSFGEPICPCHRVPQVMGAQATRFARLGPIPAFCHDLPSPALQDFHSVSARLALIPVGCNFYWQVTDKARGAERGWGARGIEKTAILFFVNTWLELEHLFAAVYPIVHVDRARSKILCVQKM